MIVDTSALLAYFYTGEADHDGVSALIDSTTEPLVVSPYILAELDYLVLTRYGTHDELAVLAELTSGAWDLAPMDLALVRQGRAVVETYSDVPIGVADASNIVLADTWATRKIATLDRRHFSALRLPDGSYPTLLP